MRLTPWLHSLDSSSVARLLALRPEASNPGPTSLPHLAQRLSSTASVAAAVARLDRDCLLVAQSVVVLGDGTAVDQLRSFLPAAGSLLDDALARLRERALVWPGTRPGTLRITVALERHWRHPLALGPAAETVLDPMTKDPIRQIAQRLGVVKGNTRDDAVRNICRALSNATAVRERISSASAQAQALLTDLAFTPASVPPPRHTWQDRYRPVPSQERLPAEELYDLGLLFVASEHGHAVLPREIALVVRGPERSPDLTGPPVITTRPVGADVGAAGMVALNSLEELRRVLDAAGAQPLAPVRAGGLGQREVQRVSRVCALGPDATRLWLELAVRTGLLGPDVDGRYRPTSRLARWQSMEAARRWALLAGAWWHSGQGDPGDAPLQRLAESVLHSLTPAGTLDVRRAVIEVLADLPPDHTTDALAHAASWRLPTVTGADARIPAIVAEAESLGATVAAVITPLGRALARGTDDLEAVTASLLPPLTPNMALQSDLTAVTVGAVPAATEHLLRAAADREGVGVWRFSRASVRRALDGGQTGDRLLEELAALSTGDLPQVLTRLIRDVARGHGNLRIHPCGCCLVASEESVLAEVLGEGLDLHRVAPTVAVGPGSATDLVHDLRRLGYAPVVDPVRGTTRLEGRAKGRKRPTDRRGVDSPPPVPPSTEPGVAGVAGLALFDLPDPSQGRRDPLETARQLCRDPARTDRRIEAAVNRLVSYDDGQRCHTRLTADELRLLARAQEDGLAVIIEKSRSLISSATSRYLLDEVSIEHAQVRGWDPRWESEATFRVSDLTSVQAATTAVSLS